MSVQTSLNEQQVADAQLDHLRLKMAGIRRQLDSEVEAVRETAGDLVDWKHYAKLYPWLFVGTAVALGFAVVPRRMEIIRPDPDTLAALAKSNRLVVTDKPETRERPGWADTVFRLLSHAVFRAGTSYLAQQFGARAGEEAAETADSCASTRRRQPSGRNGYDLMQNRLFPLETRKRPPAPPQTPGGWVQRSMQRAESFIGAHPAAALALGATLGVTLGWLIKRKT